MMQLRFTFAALTLLALPLATRATEMPYGWNVTNGFRSHARVAYVSPPSEPGQVALPTGTSSPEAKRLLDDLFKRNNTKALLVAQDGQLLYERYSFGVGRRNTPLGYSMSKSLTALAVGHAVCDGHIASVDDVMKKYVPALAGTAWGEATVRDILKMSSGAYRTTMQYNGHKYREFEQSIGAAVAEGRMNTDFLELMKQADEKEFPPGSVFNYNNFDTVALGLLVQSASGMPFPAYFERSVWKSAGAETRGAWFMTNKGQTSTYQGFSASPHDWIRIGMMVLRDLRDQDKCIGKFLKDATSSQASSWGPASSYGYQIWVRCASQTDFCFVGFGGQHLLFNVATNTVLYHHATTFSSIVWGTPRVMDELIPHLSSSTKPRQ